MNPSWILKFQFCLGSIQLFCSVAFDSLKPHRLKHARPPCASPIPRACSNSCPLTQWCHPTISSSVVPFSSCLQSFPASESFPISQFFASGGQSTGVSASASVLSKNIQDWFPLGLTGWISLLSKELSRLFSNTTVQKNHHSSKRINPLMLSFLYSLTLISIHDHWKNHSLDRVSLTWLLCPFKIHQPFKIPVSEGGDIYTHTADSHCCTVEINTTL